LCPGMNLSTWVKNLREADLYVVAETGFHRFEDDATIKKVLNNRMYSQQSNRECSKIRSLKRHTENGQEIKDGLAVAAALKSTNKKRSFYIDLFTRTTKSCRTVSRDTPRTQVGLVLIWSGGVARHKNCCSCKQTFCEPSWGTGFDYFKGIFTRNMNFVSRDNARQD
jgi:hypothetical protein